MPKVIIVGAGMIGAAAAYQLQAARADVTVIDAGKTSATAASFGWINSSFYLNADHRKLRIEGIAAHLRLCAQIDLPVNWCGSLCWEHEGAAFDRQRDELAAIGYDVEEIDAAAFAALEPQIGEPPARCLRFKSEAAAESRKMANALLRAAIDRGARIFNGLEVTGFLTQGERVAGVQTNAGKFTADHVLLAAGTATGALANTLGINLPILDRPALAIKTRPVEPIIRHVLVAWFGEVRQLPDGSITIPATVGHQADTAAKLAEPADILAAQAMDRLRALLPGRQLELGQVVLAHRPMPGDELPVAGEALPGLTIAVMHSGITLGALMGELIAAELLGGDCSHWLAPYRPERFTTTNG